MKRRLSIIPFLILFLLFCTYVEAKDVHVRGHYRKDGTYVRPHYRSAPDGNPYNNYSFPGNYNPYTGKIAPGNPETYLEKYNRRKYNSPLLPSNETVDPRFYQPNQELIPPNLDDKQVSTLIKQQIDSKVYALRKGPKSRFLHRKGCPEIYSETELVDFSSRNEAINGNGLPCPHCKP